MTNRKYAMTGLAVLTAALCLLPVAEAESVGTLVSCTLLFRGFGLIEVSTAALIAAAAPLLLLAVILLRLPLWAKTASALTVCAVALAACRLAVADGMRWLEQTAGTPITFHPVSLLLPAALCLLTAAAVWDACRDRQGAVS